MQRRVMRCWSLSEVGVAQEAAGEGEDENRTFASFLRVGRARGRDRKSCIGAGQARITCTPSLVPVSFSLFSFSDFSAREGTWAMSATIDAGRNSAVRAVELSRAVMFDAAAGALRPP